MNTNSLKSIWLIALLLMGISLLSLYRAEISARESMQGDLIFANSLGDISDFTKIVIETPENQVSLQKDERLWRVAEADNYYASFSKMQSLLDNISSARLGRKVTTPATEIIWKSMTLFDEQDKKVKSVVIGKALNQDVYYIHHPEDKIIHFSTWKMELPDNLFSWTRQPLIDFDGKRIAKIEKNNKIVSRREEGDGFYNNQKENRYLISEDYFRVFEILTDLHYERVLSSQEFSPEKYPHKQTLNLTTFDGLVTTIIVYTDQKEYWLQVKLSANRLPSTETKEYIEQNKPMYEDWWFKIDDTEGQALFNFRF